MKIGIDVRLWNQTGVGRYIRNLVVNLQKIDKKNDYVLFAIKEDAKEIKLINPKWKLVIADIRWHSLKEQYELPKVLNKENLDLVHFPYFSVPLLYKKPFVVTIHDLIMQHYPTGKASTLPLPLYRAKKIGYSRVIKNAVKKSEKIIVPLNSVKEDLIKSLRVSGEKIAVTYEGVDANIKGTSEKNKYGKYFVYVGNAYPHKNLDRLIDAFEILKKEETDVKLVLVGKDDFFYKKLETKHNDPSIIYLHSVTDTELSSLYKNAIAFISASVMEGFGLPAIEAISNDCLVLLSNIPSFKEVCGESAIYFDPLSEKDIARKMDAVLQNGKKYYFKDLQKSKERLKLFSWEKMSKDTLKVYEGSISLR